MRYKEAFEMIDMSIKKANLGYPVSDGLKNVLLDQAVEKVGTQICMKKRKLTITNPGIVNQINRLDFTRKVYKIEENDVNLPYISEEQMNTSTDIDTISHNAWYVNADYAEGTITDITSSTTTQTVTHTGTAPGVGALVKFSEIIGYSGAAGVEHPFNGKTFELATGTTTTLTFETIDLSSGYAAYGSGGYWQEVSLALNFLKKPSYDVTVYYYAKPRARQSIISEIDIPDMLVPGAVHIVLGQLFAQDGQLQIAAGHRGMAKSMFEDYMKSRTSREQFPDILPNPMSVFK